MVLGMEEDLAGAGYNVNQSKIAIGSGGLWGKGFLNGTQTKLKYVPEQDMTDMPIRSLQPLVFTREPESLAQSLSQVRMCSRSRRSKEKPDV